MAVSIRQYGDPANSSGGQYFTFPGGAVQVGSLLVWIGVNSGCPDASYTAVSGSPFAAGSTNIYVYRKVATAADTRIDVGYNNYYGMWLEIAGVDASTFPLDGVAFAYQGTSGQHSVTTASVTESKGNGSLIAVAGLTNNGGTAPLGSAFDVGSSGMTKVGSLSNDSQAAAMTAFLQNGLSAGATGGRTLPYSDTNNFGSSTLFAVSLAVRSPNTAPSTPGAPTISPTTVDSTGATISWTASVDPDGDAMSYELDYSPDGGTNWQSLSTNAANGVSTWNFSGFAPTTNAKLRVRAKDAPGNYSAYATMAGTFTVAHTPYVPPVML